MSPDEAADYLRRNILSGDNNAHEALDTLHIALCDAESRLSVLSEAAEALVEELRGVDVEGIDQEGWDVYNCREALSSAIARAKRESL